MIGWLKLNDDQRRASLEQAAQIKNMKPYAIEKDWWVTLSLKALFQTPYAEHMIFKGGTSLSKCWGIIQRFSEDVDIALDPSAFNMHYKAKPTKSEVERLRRNGCLFISTKLKEALELELIKIGVPKGLLKIEAEEINQNRPDKDPQTIFIDYPSLYDPNPYLKDEVKIEVGVRSLKEPFTKSQVQSILYESFPNEAYKELPIELSIVEPRKTFLEKVFLLHEEFLKPDLNKIRIERMSRHLYDLVNMMDRGIDKEALSDSDLYEVIIAHRKYYSRLSHIDYQTLGRSTVYFLPSKDLQDAYKKDYETMAEQMIYGEPILFES
jgi:predicted nucleotidyltransferase component of viral defense system